MYKEGQNRERKTVWFTFKKKKGGTTFGVSFCCFRFFLFVAFFVCIFCNPCWTNQPINQSINQSNQSINQPTNERTNEQKSKT